MIAVSKKGFTLVELLVVISIIGLLSTIAVVSLGGSRAKARDAKRLADMRQLMTALNLYQEVNGCLPITNASTCPGNGGYSEWNAGAWDYSSQGGFMTFLVSSGLMAKVPVDPINNMTGDGSPAGSYGYFYYCYPSGPSLGYFPELNYARTTVLVPGTDSSYVCK
jgi:prepilin-type N-terminal cleavage/methylation domain-containing protein